MQVRSLSHEHVKAAVSIKHRGVWDSWLFCHHQCLAWIHLDPSSIL